ncbi:MAG TPA: hypothetical protein VFJ82_17320 [Longimicrobium sp.]|nr:hypothetical protein [Longimicrobium sp.]
MVKASPELVWGFALLALVVAAAFPLLVYRAARAAGETDAVKRGLRAALVTAVWLALTFAAAASGRLRFDTVPPTMGIVLIVAWAMALRIGLGRTGARLAEATPLGLLVLVQAFRLPLELLMHRAYGEGLMPVQMSFSGRNFDIVTGTTALLLGVAMTAWRGRVPHRLVLAWNVLGSLLLANVLVIAVLSTPTPLRVFMNEPANVWITHAPWVWLATVFVPAAIAGHVIIFRRLRMEARRRVAAPSPSAERQPSRELSAVA